jgi:hypothetical protein
MLKWLPSFLLALAGLTWADGASACNRPSGSATNASRMPSGYPMPRMSVTFANRSVYPRIYPRVFPGGGGGYSNTYPGGGYSNYYPGNNYNRLLEAAYGGYGYTPTPAVASYAPPTSPEPRANKPPAPLLAPSLPARPEPVALAVGTNRLRYVAMSVRDLPDARSASRIEEELGKLPGVRGVNVKRWDFGPASVKVWFSEQAPVAAAEVLGEMSRLGFTASVVE